MYALLFAYFLLYFLAAFVWPTWRLWKREQVNALVLPHDDSAHGVVAAWFRGLTASIFLVLAALAGGIPHEQLGLLPWLQHPPAQIAGWALLLTSLGWIALAQRQMGRSWRIGIDTVDRPPLVRAGIFALSRNPIFLGMRVNLAGLFLVAPNAATLAALIVGEALIQVQVRLEEVHLESVFGSDYRAYRGGTPRWI